jgi:hypothetical protein
VRTHIYTSPGTRKVRVRAVGSNGSVGIGETDVIVN